MFHSWQSNAKKSIIISMLRFLTSPLFFSYLGGVLYAASFPMKFAPSLSLGSLFGLILFFKATIFADNLSIKQAIGRSILFSLGFYALGFYWIPGVIRIFGSIPFPFDQVLGLFFALIVLPHYTFLLILFAKFKDRLYSISDSYKLFLLACIFTLVEYCFPQQFPAHVGHAFLFLSPFIKPATVFGAPIYSFFVFWMALIIAQRKFNPKNNRLPIFLFLAFIASHFLLGKIETPKKVHTTESIRFVQANIGSLMKVDSESGKTFALSEVRNIYRELSLRPAKKPLDLIIWPETAYPALLYSRTMRNNPDSIPDLVKEVTSKQNAQFFMGGYDYLISNDTSDIYFETEFNTVYFFDRSAKVKQLYHKMKLIPFGESLPFGKLNRYISRYVQNISYFASGKEMKLFETDKGSPFTSAICYEILFSHFLRSHLNNLKKDPYFLINVTNDSWYGDTSEPEQHLFLSKWRAVEFNLPVLRMTNTGITSILYPDGSESERLGVNARDILDLQMHVFKREKTLFQKYGIYNLILLWPFIFGLLFLANRRKS